ncbi:MAG: glycosyltransferase [Bacteroidetes bacterium]|nr:glycosyltransferase [Fibrella sp.]
MIQLSNQRQPEPAAPAPTPYLFDELPPSPALRVSVVVPVRNEADHLQQTLDALRNQQYSDGSAVPYRDYEVLLLANNCTDQSYELARHYQRCFPDFPLHVASVWLTPDKANIGYVRRLLMDEACRRLLATGNRLGIIASTDGDTVVDRHWISQTMAEIERGNDAIGGRILTPRRDRITREAAPADESGCPDAVRRYHLLDVTYRHLVARVEALLDPVPNDPWPRHFQHFAASLAVTCATYLKAGRLPEVVCMEDEAFYQALLRVDAKIRKSPLVKVVTSTRTQGRVAVGFSWQLNQWAAMTSTRQLPLVEGADVVLSRFRHRRQLRDCWQTMAHTDRRADLLAIASELQIDTDWLCQETALNQYFGQLYENVVKQSPVLRQPPSLIPVTAAIQELRDFLHQSAR